MKASELNVLLQRTLAKVFDLEDYVIKLQGEIDHLRVELDFVEKLREGLVLALEEATQNPGKEVDQEEPEQTFDGEPKWQDSILFIRHGRRRVIKFYPNETIGEIIQTVFHADNLEARDEAGGLIPSDTLTSSLRDPVYGMPRVFVSSKQLDKVEPPVV